MTDEQIDFLGMVLKVTTMKVFFRDSGTLIPVTGIQKEFLDKDSELAEPVAWLNNNSCVALFNVLPEDMQIISSGECF